MKKRKNEEHQQSIKKWIENDLKKDAKKLVIIDVLFVLLIVLIVICKFGATSGEIIHVGLATFLYLLGLEVLTVVIVSYFEYKYHYKEIATDQLIIEPSNELVKKLVINEPIKVKIINLHNNVYEQFVREIEEIADFYAILGEDNLIKIICKFTQFECQKEIIFDIVSKEYFSSYYKVL